ncbi:hypothetical protein HANVADRAFT_26831 [Hanseniaspora valbyensis NRRL Y-1626]|uniref:Small ribosomal subunit protein mS23 n=1 Tax=Hanseniaspora valbyensis NRRL Y-1626 TaxID=766949 RepID=A0A1B7TA39_9ASCO|nr:hypothetical protein HANVADRAFT_26831 [Hanseniaspora valbyensis NRRL Y-1626]
MSKKFKTTRDLIRIANERIQARVYEVKPVWYDSIMKYPPLYQKNKTHELNKKNTFLPSFRTRTPSLFTNSNKTPGNKNLLKKQTQMYTKNKVFSENQSAGLQFVEDKIKMKFYDQHPWELTNPKILIEQQNNILNLDLEWSKVNPTGKQLDGDSVAQRTIYIMNNENMNLFDAYNKALLEFYERRIEEEFEMSVAIEESEMFGMLYNDYNNGVVDTQYLKEQKDLMKWKEEALANVLTEN